MKIDGKPVVDATRPIHVRITRQDTILGKSKSPASCAAALACVRDTKCTEARVHLSRTYLLVKDKWVRFATPDAIRSEIIGFDRGAKFQPGDYSFRPMNPANRLGVGKGSDTSRNKPNHKKTKRLPYHVVADVRQRMPIK